MRRDDLEWKIIQEFPSYEIDSAGTIRRKVDGQCGHKAGLVLKPGQRGGRNRTTLRYHGKIGRFVFVDELVALTFHGPCPGPGFYPQHLDGNTLNDAANNVVWQLPKGMAPDSFIWKEIPNFSAYQIREDGVVRRCKPATNGKTNQIGKILKPHANSKYGHQLLILRRDDGVIKGHSVHNLVARAFYGLPPTPEHEAAHNDGNPSHNHYKNIRWATSQENANDKFLHGTNLVGEQNPRAILSTEDVLQIRKELTEPKRRTYQQIADYYGVSRGTIDYLVRKGWKSVVLNGSTDPVSN